MHHTAVKSDSQPVKRIYFDHYLKEIYSMPSDRCANNVLQAGKADDQRALQDSFNTIATTIPAIGDTAACKQFIRYALVGLGSNAVSYFVYVVVTWLGVESKTAMTWLYLLGAIQTFVFNKQWSFRFRGAPMPALVRYAMAYGFGYVVNLLGLMFFVDHAGMPHHVVQGAMIVTVAVLLFVAQKYWIFPAGAAGASA